MNIAGMMRVRNEARWIERSIESILPLCNAGIHILDDHSTDDTVAIARFLPNVAIERSPFSGLNESRDKNYLLNGMGKNLDWVVCIDGDEALTPDGLVNLELAMRFSNATALSLPIWYLWDREDQMRVDGVYGNFHRESVFRPVAGAHFHEGPAPNFHCGNVPPDLRHNRQVVNAPLLHYGYMERDDRLRKYSWYNAKDPGNHSEDCYRHMVQGDIVDVPADAILKHGGPLRLRAI